MKGYCMFKKLAQQLRDYDKKTNTAPVSVPFAKEFLKPKNKFLNNLSKKAVELYERQQDINHFTKLVLSDPENKSHNKMVNELFEDGVADPFVDEKLADLANNQKFLRDLGLL